MGDLVKISVWVTEAEAEAIKSAAKAEKRPVSGFAKIVLLEHVEKATA